MFGIGYINKETKKVVDLLHTYHNFETAKSQGKVIQNHPAFNDREVVVLDYSQKRAYALYSPQAPRHKG